MTSSTSTLTLKPWARHDDDETSLGSVLARIQLDRGHFRDITEQSLQEEIAAEGALKLSESESSGEDEDDDDDDGRAQDKAAVKPSTVEDLIKAKFEMLQHVRAAQDDIDYARDFISLLISKDLPRQAALSMAPNLAKEIPMGTLGADIWHRMPVDEAREAQDDTLAVNVRMAGLQKSADGLLDAAARLESNMRRETNYWEQILSISEQGWNVSKIPGQHHRLGVRFGFNQSAPEFARRGLVALNASEDGSIALDWGVGSKPKAVRAVLRKHGKIIGVSRLPRLSDEEETTLETRIRHARDSLFDEELYHEIIRESRSLAAIGVRVDKSGVVCSLSNIDLEIAFDLQPIDRMGRFDTTSSGEADALAHATVLAARLLLMQAHRDRLVKKSELPVPMSDSQRPEKPLLPILRPLLSFAMHRSSLDRINAYMMTVKETLGSADVDATLSEAEVRLASKHASEQPSEVIASLMEPWVAQSELTIAHPSSDAVVISIVCETTLARSLGSVFTLRIPSRAEQYQFEAIDDLISATDDKLASVLATALSTSPEGDWGCLQYEAAVVPKPGKGRGGQRIDVEMAKEGSCLSASSGDRVLCWRAEGETHGSGFWNTLEEVATHRPV